VNETFDLVTGPTYLVARCVESANHDDLFIWKKHEDGYRIFAGPFVAKDTAKRWMWKLCEENPYLKTPTV